MIRTASDLLAQFRATAAPIQSAPARTNTKAPISEADQGTIRAHIADNQPAWLLAFYDLGIQTGWRTADCANLRYDAIDWDAGTVTITVAKQTKAAQARAMAKGLKEIREARQAAAMAAGDAVAYMNWAAATRDELAAAASAAELDRLSQLVASAARKTSTKPLSADLLARLKGMEAAAFWADGYVFSRALSASNSARLDSGKPLTRQTMWARLKGVFAAVADQVANAAKLSAYSLRKSFARNMLAKTNNIAAVMELMGHSSIEMTQRYLGLMSEAEKAQAAYVGREVAA